MDQVKMVLAVLGKYHFWVACGLVVIVVVAIYASASGKLTEEFENNKGTIESQINTVSGFGNDPIPTRKIAEIKRKQTAKWKIDTLEAWEFLYEDQKKYNPWPQELGNKFLVMINGITPDKPIPYRFRDLYRNFVYGHFQP